MRLVTLAAILSAPLLMANTGGCQSNDIPSTAQIEMHIPDGLLQCPNAPRSPGRGASQGERARYIIKLYEAWKECKGDNESIERLYRQYRVQLQAFANKD